MGNRWSLLVSGLGTPTDELMLFPVRYMYDVPEDGRDRRYTVENRTGSNDIILS